MPDAQKYRNTMNLGREDENKMGWKLGQIVHVAIGSTANRYEYCGYPEMEIPGGARARLIGIKQTDLNACYHNGVGDVYVDFELLDYTNEDGTPITCGNRHAWSLCEANPDFAYCPDGSGEPGYIRREGFRHGGLWVSLETRRLEDDPVTGAYRSQPRKIVDPVQYT
jgi:hypothetical protein